MACSAATAQYTEAGRFCSSGSALPTTGLDLVILIVAAVVLLALGLALWRLGKAVE